MLSKKELFMLEANISDKSESDIQDQARLNIIEQLSAQGFYDDADNLVYKLNYPHFEDEARIIISRYRTNGIVKPINHIPLKYDRLDKIKETLIIVDPEIEYKSILNYLKLKRTKLTTSTVNHIKWRINLLKDIWLRKTLFKKLDIALAEYQISLKKEDIQSKQRESSRIKKLELEAKKEQSISNRKQIILSNMTKTEKDMYLSSELSLESAMWVFIKKSQKKIKKGKKPKINSQFSKAERKRLFKIYRSL